MTLFVMDTDAVLQGTVTDGDIRRALLAGQTLDAPVACAMHRDFRRMKAGEPDQVDEIRKIRQTGITLIPVVDDSNRLTGIVDLSQQYTVLPLTAILMAGGKGERLRPLTLTVPKPLLEIDGKAIIDYNIEALVHSGITDITVTTGYLADKISEHFAGTHVKCVREDKPLGTLGAATLVPRSVPGNTLIMNSDLLTTVSFEDMYLRHRDSHADITVGVIPYQLSVPYAILATRDDNDAHRVTGIEEKPSYSYYANAGIYIVSNELLDTLPPDTRTDATDFIAAAIEAGRTVTYYVIDGTWIDVGSPTDFRQAAELMRHHRNLSHR